MRTGEIAALGTAVCWGISTNLFAAAGKKMDAGVLNRLRITVACGFLAVALLAVHGSPWPYWATPSQTVLLVASGIAGFVFGDYYYFKSLAILGPARASLLASAAPIFTMLLALPALGESPGTVGLFGMALTLGGLFLVLKTRVAEWTSHTRGSFAAGVTAGILASIGQAVGYVISKEALRTGIDPLSATVVRIATAAVGVWLLGLFGKRASHTMAALRNRRAAIFMAAGSFVGPFLGVTLSLVAIRYIETGIASSITAVYPVLAMLISWRFHGEKLTPRMMAGTCIAVAGVIVLFLR